MEGHAQILAVLPKDDLAGVQIDAAADDVVQTERAAVVVELVRRRKKNKTKQEKQTFTKNGFKYQRNSVKA